MPLYNTADFFTVRYANLPYKSIDVLNDYDPESLIAFYRENPLFQEAVALASIQLHLALKKWERIPNKTPYYQSLSKYLIRMSSRTTPFGLFSSVGWGSFSERTNLPFDECALKKRAFPSAECTGELIDAIHEDQVLVKQLKVMLNPQLVYKKERIYLNYDNSNFQTNYTSIRMSSVYENVFDLAQSPILYSELIDQMIDRYSEDYREKIEPYLWELFERKFLISELNAPNIITDFHSVYERLYNLIPDRLKTFDELVSNIQKYETGSAPLLLLESINQHAESLSQKIKNPMRIDHFCEGEKTTLHNHLRNDLEKMLDAIVKMSYIEERPKHLNDFHTFFLEKYGTERLIPLHEINQIEEALLLLEASANQDNPTDINRVASFLGESAHQEEIDIKALLESLPELTQSQKEKICPSVDLCFELEADNPSCIESGNYTLIFKGVMHQAGSLIGRFLYNWDDDQHQSMKKLVTDEGNCLPHAQYVEPSFVPEKRHVSNVSIGSQLRPYRLPMNYHCASENDIHLDDLYIGADHD